VPMLVALGFMILIQDQSINQYSIDGEALFKVLLINETKTCVTSEKHFSRYLLLTNESETGLTACIVPFVNLSSKDLSLAENKTQQKSKQTKKLDNHNISNTLNVWSKIKY
jgi:hypothetical protein